MARPSLSRAFILGCGALALVLLTRSSSWFGAGNGDAEIVELGAATVQNGAEQEQLVRPPDVGRASGGSDTGSGKRAPLLRTHREPTKELAFELSKAADASRTAVHVGTAAFAQTIGDDSWPEPRATCTLLLDPISRRAYVWQRSGDDAATGSGDLATSCHVLTGFEVISSGRLFTRPCRGSLPHFDPPRGRGPVLVTSLPSSDFRVRKLGVPAAKLGKGDKDVLSYTRGAGIAWALPEKPWVLGLFSISRYAQFHNLPVNVMVGASAPLLQNSDGVGLGNRGADLAKLSALAYALRRHDFALWLDPGTLLPNLGISAFDLYRFNARGQQNMTSVVLQGGQWVGSSAMLCRSDDWVARLLRIMWADRDGILAAKSLRSDHLALQHAILKLTDRTEHQEKGRVSAYSDECLAPNATVLVKDGSCWTRYSKNLAPPELERHVTVVALARANNTDPAMAQLHCGLVRAQPIYGANLCRAPVLAVQFGSSKPGETNPTQRLATSWSDYRDAAYCLVGDLVVQKSEALDADEYDGQEDEGDIVGQLAAAGAA